MIKLNKTTEYALISIKHMALKESQSVSAREISDHYQIPFEILSKTLQKMKEQEIILSTQGSKGGYTLHPALSTMSFLHFLDKIEGTQAMVSCVGIEGASAEATQSSCHSGMQSSCTIKGILQHVNEHVRQSLNQISLQAFIGTFPTTSFSNFNISKENIL